MWTAFLGHQEKVMTYSVRQQRLSRELSNHINRQLDAIWESRNELVAMDILDTMMGNLTTLARLSEEQLEMNVVTTEANLDMVRELLQVPA
jgi:hypothetical protein